MDVTPANDRSSASADPARSEGRKQVLERQLEWSLQQVQELSAELRQLQLQLRGQRDHHAGLEQERSRLTRQIVDAEKLVRSMEVGLEGMRRSRSMKLGYLLSSSLRAPKDLFRLPARLAKLLRDPNSNEPVPIPVEWYPTELRNELCRFYGTLDVQGARDVDREKRTKSRSIHHAFSPRGELPRDLSGVRIAAVMDQFTFSAYRECCAVTQLTPSNWHAEINEIQPHFLFLESAWDGKDGQWQRKVSGASEELTSLTAYCRSAGIPVIFWSKEDPVHFKAFLGAARLADVVFTTDIDCVKHYKTELGHDNVYLLPFAAQPKTHNPIESYQRKPGFCFAGSYYRRYPVRQLDFDALIEGVGRLGDVDIFDRNHGKDHPNYTFPEEYAKYIVGSLPFNQIDLAYKGYNFGININTVKHSQSMFARRVFDLLASNTITVSNYSRGLRLMFGDLVLCSDDPDQLEHRLRPFVENPSLRRKHRLAGLRKTLREHTYQHRVAYVWKKLYGTDLVATGRQVVVVAAVGSAQALARVLASFNRQTWQEKLLILTYQDGFRPASSPTGPRVHVFSEKQAASRLVGRLVEDGCVATFHPDDHYGPEYLTDLALAMSYTPVAAVGKIARYVLRDGVPVLADDGSQYRLAGPIPRRRGAVLCSAAGAVSVAEWVLHPDAALTEGPAFAIDEFSYCQGGAGLTCASAVDGVIDVDEGLPVTRLLELAEGIDADPIDTTGSERDESAGLPGLEASELLSRLGTCANPRVQARQEGNGLIVSSELPRGKHAYWYLQGPFPPESLGFTDIGKFQLVADQGDGLQLVFVYKDDQGEKISHSILSSALNVTVTLPDGTSSVEVGIKVTGPGEFRIRRLAFAHVPLPVEMMVTRGRHLVLAKNYPSYDDLYKHAFVHRRVLEYRKRGVDVDVFRIGADGLSFYEFDGVDVAYGQADHLRAMLKSGRYESVLVHFLDERMAAVLSEFIDRTRVFVWAHGAEIQSAGRREFDHQDDPSRQRAVALGDRRMRFWRGVFSEAHPNLHMIFVSRWFAQDVMQDVGLELPVGAYRIIHNFIDTELFSYHPKPAGQRRKILSIRPFESAKYANDLSVAAVLALRDKPFFEELEFRFVGDGRLFEETMAPLQALPNVTIERRFLQQSEIAALHREYGIFLTPTRMDAQGVSRDEAMSSGLVPISTRCTAIPEFVDSECGILVEPEDAQGIADAIEKLYCDPERFLRLSRQAAARVRSQSGFDTTIAREIQMFEGRDLPPADGTDSCP